MATLNGPSSSIPHPRFRLQRIRRDAQRALAGAGQAASAPAPAMTVQPLGAYTSAMSMSNALRKLLDRLGSFLANLVPPTAPTPTPAPTPAPGHATGGTDFTISDFNVLGSNHTAPGGNNQGYASGVERTRMAIQQLRDHHIDVVGFQEMKPDQAREFNRSASDYGLFPGDKRGNLMSDNSIAWRKDTWDLVSAQVLDMPSLNGRNQPSPLVRLKNKQTGQEVYFLNVHNAPGYHKGGTQQNWRDAATAKQTALVNRLKQQTGLPVVVTGDFNDKEKAFTTMTGQAGLHAANAGPGGRMPKRMSLDWIFGSQSVRFSGFTNVVKGVYHRITDHAMIMSRAHIDA